MIATEHDIARALECVRLARERMSSFRKELEAGRPRHRNLVSRSWELLAQSEELLAKVSTRRMMHASPYLVHDHLAQAERHVRAGLDIIARQRQVVAALQRGGHDTREAVELLGSFEAVQQLHVTDRDRLRSKLGIA